MEWGSGGHGEWLYCFSGAPSSLGTLGWGSGGGQNILCGRCLLE